MDNKPFAINSAIFPPAVWGNLGRLMSVLITNLITLTAVLSIILIIYSGFNFITARGDEKKVASSKSTITYALIGLVVAILSFTIIQVVQYLLGSSVNIIG